MLRKMTDMRNKLTLLLLGLALATAVPAQAQLKDKDTIVQLSNRSMPDTAWQRLSADPEISRYKNMVEATPELKEPGEQRREEPFLLRIILGIINFFGTLLGTVLLWLFVACVVLYILYRLVGSQGRFSFGKERKFSEGTEQAEAEDVEGTDWDSRFAQAVAAGDTRLAVRYSYMHALQLLQARELIRYRIDKTNHDYYYELADTPFRQPFRQLSRQYEYAWYGNYPLSPEAWEEYLHTFRTLKSNLKA